MAKVTTLDFDGSALLNAMSELNLYLDRLPDTFRQLMGQIILNRGKLSPKIISSETSVTSVDGTVLIIFKPSNLFLELLSACRTGNLDNLIVQCNLQQKTSKKGIL